MVNYELLGKIQYGSMVKYDSILKTSGSSAIFLQDILYRDKDLLEYSIPHLLSVNQEYYGPLYDLLHRCHDVFPG